MAIAAEQKVITYLSIPDRPPDDSYRELEKALGEGYAVVDIISVASNAGGESNSRGVVAVTVFLAKSANGLEYYKADKS